MNIEKIYAQLACRDGQRSAEWFARLFGRDADARPMEGLAEWHHGEAAGLQLFRNPANAGHGTLTLIVRALEDEQARLTEAGLEPSAIEGGNTVALIRLRDPDGNLVVLAQPGGV